MEKVSAKLKKKWIKIMSSKIKNLSTILAPISMGELIDKITILKLNKYI